MKCDKCGGDMTPCVLFTSTVWDCPACATAITNFVVVPGATLAKRVGYRPAAIAYIAPEAVTSCSIPGCSCLETDPKYSPKHPAS